MTREETELSVLRLHRCIVEDDDAETIRITLAMKRENRWWDELISATMEIARLREALRNLIDTSSTIAWDDCAYVEDSKAYNDARDAAEGALRQGQGG